MTKHIKSAGLCLVITLMWCYVGIISLPYKDGIPKACYIIIFWLYMYELFAKSYKTLFTFLAIFLWLIVSCFVVLFSGELVTQFNFSILLIAYILNLFLQTLELILSENLKD